MSKNKEKWDKKVYFINLMDYCAVLENIIKIIKVLGNEKYLSCKEMVQINNELCITFPHLDVSMLSLTEACRAMK